MQDLSNGGHVALIWVLMVVLYIVFGLRTWALRTTEYGMLSPRGVSTICIATTVFLTTVVCATVTWSLVGPYHNVPTEFFNIIYSKDLASDGGFHFPYDPEPLLEMVFKVNFGSMLLFYIVLWLVKVAFVVIYFEFSSELSKLTRTLLYVTIAATVVSFTFVICLYNLWCLPTSSNWAFEEIIQANACRASTTPSVIVSVINVLTDILIMAAGFSIIRSLNLPRGDFRSAFLIITIGTLTVVVAFIRMVVLIVRMTKTDQQYNSSYSSADLPEGFQQEVSVAVQESVVGYAEIEAILACIAACLPGIRVLFRTRVMRDSQRLTFKDCSEGSVMSFGGLSPPASPPMVYEQRTKGVDIV